MAGLTVLAYKWRQRRKERSIKTVCGWKIKIIISIWCMAAIQCFIFMTMAAAGGVISNQMILKQDIMRDITINNLRISYLNQVCFDLNLYFNDQTGHSRFIQGLCMFSLQWRKWANLMVHRWVSMFLLFLPGRSNAGGPLHPITGGKKTYDLYGASEYRSNFSCNYSSYLFEIYEW